jgi:hypothetical protein
MKTMMVITLAMLMVAQSAGAVSPNLTGWNGGAFDPFEGNVGTTSYTTSTFNVEVLHTTTVNQRVDQFSVEVIGRMAGGSILFDQTFNVPYTDPAVQAAVAQARKALTDAGAVSITGSPIVSSTTTLVDSSSSTVQTDQTAAVSFNTAVYIGPQVINAGALPSCPGCSLDPASPDYPTYASISLFASLPPQLTLVAGAQVYDTLVISQVDTYQTTTLTDTYLTTQTYELIGAEKPHTLAVVLAGPGSGIVTSNPKGISCGSDNSTCAYDFPSSAKVTLTAKADQGSKFTGWSDGCSGTGKCTVPMSGSDVITVSAHFSSQATVVPPVTSWDFKTVAVGKTASYKYKLKNGGTLPLSVSLATPAFTGSNPGEFRIASNTCTNAVAPNGTCTITVTFGPTSPGAKSATLSLKSNDPDHLTFALSLTGTGSPRPGD